MVGYIVKLRTADLQEEQTGGQTLHELEGMEMMRVALALAFAFLMPVVDSAQAAKPMFRPDYIEYVCGIKGGQPKTYFNLYFARNDGATQIRPGKCEVQQYRAWVR